MGFGYYLMQALLLAGLPWLGFALAGLLVSTKPEPERENEGFELTTQGNPPPVRSTIRNRRFWAILLLVGLSAAAPMTLIDPPELFLLVGLSPGEIWQWALRAAGFSLVTGVIFTLLALGVVLSRQKAGSLRSQPGLAPLAAGSIFLTAVLIGVAWIYISVGQPGFHGDNLFVIMKEQAQLAPLPGYSSPAAGREAVYTTLTEHALRTQAGLRADLERFGIAYTPFYLVNGLEVTGGPVLRIWLESRPDIERVIPNPWLRPLPEELPAAVRGSTSAPANLWSLQMIEAARTWREFGVDGEGVVIGQSDSGVQWDHPALMESYRGFTGPGQNPVHQLNWYDPWFGTTEPVDRGGHGTHTLGTALGQRVGVAPGATWFACANLPRDLGNPALYLACWQFMLAPFPQGGDPFADGEPALGADVLNNSWGCPPIEGCDPGSLQAAVAALRTAGVFVVVSAGNDGPGCSTLSSPPAIYADAFSVGAIEQSGELAFFSSLGPVTADNSRRTKPDIVAPGVQVQSALPGNRYGPNSGTSMAGPHVAGVVALMWSANPRLAGDIQRTEEILRLSARPFEGSLPDCPGASERPSTAVGYGVLNAYEAVRMALEIELP
jgi:subtilisin family serine protease